MSEQQVPEVNAFAPAFLERLEELDDVGTAQETEFSGPWKIVATEEGYALLRVYEEVREGQQPAALFADLPSALCFFAVLPSVGHSPRIELDSVRNAGWHSLSRDGSPVGRLRAFNDGFVQAAHVADCLARAPLGLAALLLASGPQSIREVGRILKRVLKPADAGTSWLAAEEFPPR
jgi:hypothetical protein